MDAKGLRQGALNAIENDISFVPDWGKNRIQAMIEGVRTGVSHVNVLGRANPILRAQRHQ
jgi:Isoleucyl-tRNA synthetase